MLEQVYPAFIFSAIVFFFFVLAGYSLAILIYRHLQKIEEPLAPAKLRCMKRFLAIGFVGVLCILYGRFLEPRRVEVTRITVESPRWKRGSPPLRIVHISDVHSDAAPLLEESLPALIAAERPDIIVFTGDSTNHSDGVPVFRGLMASLSAIAPVYAVRGNWDMWRGASAGLFQGTGVILLEGEARSFTVAGDTVTLFGSPVFGNAAFVALEASSPDSFRIFLHHMPDSIYRVSQAGADLYLAGHTHGGQVALPFYGAIITLSAHGKRFESGLYRVGNTALYVNRGIGMEGVAPRVRFFARPEITVLDVVHGTPRQ